MKALSKSTSIFATFWRRNRNTPVFAAIVAAMVITPVSAQDEDDLEPLTPESEWKYNDSGEDLGTAWREPGYDDSAWKSGFAPLGYGDTLTTELDSGPDSSNKTITQYFRKEFTIDSLQAATALIVRVQRDDGIAVYINGALVMLDNLPADATFSTPAESSIDGANERAWVEQARTTASLVAGKNVIAAEVHQSSGSSSDTRFDCQLLLSTAPPAYGEVRIGIQTKFSEGGNGLEFFTRNPLADPPEIEMNWTASVTGAQFATTIDGGILPDEEFYFYDENGDPDTQFFIWNATLREWESEKIDTRNYNNAQVKVDVRTYDEKNGFESSDEFRGEIDTSSDGNKFSTYKWLELKGGGKKAIEWTEVVNPETPRSVIVPTSATEPGDNWKAPDFDDSGWIAGTMGVGFDSPGGSFEDFIGIDTSEEMKGINSACFIRIPFTVATLSGFTDAQLRVRYDDGYVAYINGTEVASANAPSPIAWNSEATSSNPDNSAILYENIDLLESKTVSDVFVEGENILTIVGMNSSVGGSDFLNDVAIRLGKPSDDGPPLNLDGLNFGILNRKTTYTSELGEIPDGAASLIVRFEGDTNDVNGEVIYFDNIRTLGDPIAADSYYAYMQLETGWDLDDPRLAPSADPDGDSITNLLEYAFGSPPQVASLTTIVRGEEVPILPEWDVKRFGFASVSYRQISGPLATDGNNVTDQGGYHVQDILYVPQISRGEVDANGEMIWTDGRSGGEPVFEKRVAFSENEDGTIQVRLAGLRGLSGDKETYVRLLVKIVGFEQQNN
ncbi:MAG: hypothetical protein KDN22_01565 [Verrucomicrobiae bacterium]|nr:hypothetical protein [Verrucomicrobiae bacterium]